MTVRVNPIVIREVGITPETRARQSQFLAYCAQTYGLDDQLTKAYTNYVARYRVVCSRLEITVDNEEDRT